MTEEELKSIIFNLIKHYTLFDLTDDVITEMIGKILTLIRESGWKSPDQIPNATICPKCNEMHWIK